MIQEKQSVTQLPNTQKPKSLERTDSQSDTRIPPFTQRLKHPSPPLDDAPQDEPVALNKKCKHLCSLLCLYQTCHYKSQSLLCVLETFDFNVVDVEVRPAPSAASA